jgi:RNA polymerase sigma-70 factor (ECF subfamily)
VASLFRKPRKRLEALADEELIACVREGDSNAFGLLYDRHSSAAYSLAYRIVGRRETAETVLQEAFLSLWRSAERYDGERGSVRTFLFGIVHHRAIDQLRRSAVHDQRRSDDETAAERLEAPERVEGEVLERDTAGRLRRAVSELPNDQQKVIELAYFGGFTQTEIASMLDAPLGTVKGRMRLGLEKLRGALEAAEVRA